MKNYTRNLFRVFLTLSVFVKGINANSGSTSHESPDQVEKSAKIVNGATAERGNYPFVVAFFKYRYVFFCGGSIYDRSHVITAAHCLPDINATDLDDLTLSFGNWRLDVTEMGEQRRGVQSIVIHPEYHNVTQGHDVAIVQLDEPLDFTDSVKPICLTDTPLVPGEKALIMGWGKSNGTANETETFLQVAMVPIIDDEQCNHEEWLNGHVILGMFCAGFEEGQIDSCQGDSGGPIVREVGGTFQQVGIVSWGWGCANPKLPGVYADVFYYHPWIEEVAGKPDYGNSTQIKCPKSNNLANILADAFSSARIVELWKEFFFVFSLILQLIQR